jgi:alanine dehydrogenase
MPGALARTSTLGLNNATLPFVLALASAGYEQALKDDPHLLNGLNVCRARSPTRPSRRATIWIMSIRSPHSPNS